MSERSKSREWRNTNYAAYLFHLSLDMEGDACGGTLYTCTTNLLIAICLHF